MNGELKQPMPDLSGAVSRREAMKRAAVVGGSLLWAAPVAQRLGQVAAYAQVSPAPPPPPPPTTLPSISYVALVFKCNGTTYRAKWEAGGTGGKWVNVSALPSSDNESTPGCAPPAGWSDPATVGLTGNMTHHGAITVQETKSGSDVTSVTFILPDRCSFRDGAALAKGGQSCAYMTASGSTITFIAG